MAEEIIVLTVNDRGGEVWANNSGVFLSETPDSSVLEIDPQKLRDALTTLLQELDNAS